ncbi:MAG TPA: alpha/beta hydrolase [Blastocatellia bacterium]|nr:alpha/beta hydrolase [Blastocatellia bacterium]
MSGRNSNSESRWRRVAAVTIALVTVLAAVAVYALRRFETAITFHPEPLDAARKADASDRAERVWFSVGSGEKIAGIFIGSRPPSSNGAVIYFHGNTGNVSNVLWIGEALADRGCDVLLFDYRGYGGSDGESGDEYKLYEDGDAAYDYMTRSRGLAAGRVALYGQSLGTTVAIDVASRRETRALVIESGLSSADDMAGHAAPWLPGWLHWLRRYKFESSRKLSSVHCPVLITHGLNDTTIPVEQARILYAAANEPKHLEIIPGVDHNVAGSVGMGYLDRVARFIGDAQAPH